MLRWHLLKIKEIHVCKRKVNECSSEVTFWFHRLLSLSIKSDVLLDVGDLHSILQPSPSRLVPPHTLNTLVDLTACTSFDVTDYNKHGQAHVSQTMRLLCLETSTIPTSLSKDLSNPVLPSCELYSFHVVYICTLSLCGCWEGVVGRVALMSIFPSIRFELDFYRILCRILCFGLKYFQ